MVDIFQQFSDSNDRNVLISFSGEITFDLVKSFLDIVEGKLDAMESNIKVKRKVYNVLVECLQNLSHHVDDSAVAKAYERKASFVLWQDDTHYHIGTGNMVISSKVSELKERIDKVNSVSKDELREIYKQILNNQQFSEKGGGGLGFVDIARKSGQRLDYDFKTVDPDHSFFSLQIDIEKQ